MAVTQRGVLDAVAVWFDLTLFADISLSTSPSWDLSWEQAVFPLPAPSRWPQGEGEGQGVEQGDVVILHASCSDTQLKIEAEIEQEKSALQGPNEEPLPVFYVERSDLLRLNDSLYVSSYQQAITKAVATVKGEESEESGGEGGAVDSSEAAECLLLDMCEGLSLFGLAAAKLGTQQH